MDAEAFSDKLVEVYDALKEHAWSSGYINFKAVPKPLRLEVVKLYLHCNDPALLESALGLPTRAIFLWHRRYEKCPQEFGQYYRRPRKRHSLVEKVITGQMKHPKKSTRVKFPYEFDHRPPRSLLEIHSMVPDAVIRECEELKSEVNFSETGQPKIKKGIKKRIVRLALQVKNPLPVAILLGINYKLILSWHTVLEAALEGLLEGLEKPEA